MGKALKSAICAAILAACEIKEQASDEDRQDFLRRCVRGINGLKDAEYDKLDDAVIGWFEKAGDVVDANKKGGKKDPLPEFPDLEAAEEETRSRRRRSSDDDGPAEKEPALTPETVKAGMYVTIITQKGREYSNVKVVEKGKDFVVVDDGKGEVEIDFDRIGSIEIFNDGAKKDDQPAGPKDPEVGDTVELVTKRGRTVKGELIEIDDEMVVVKSEEGDEDFGRDRVASIKVTKSKDAGTGGGKKAETTEKDETASTRRKRSDDSGDEGKDKAGDDGEAKRARGKGGVSVSQSIQELILDNQDADEAAIGKKLKAAGVDARENTIHLNFEATHKLLKLMKDRKLLKA